MTFLNHLVISRKILKYHIVSCDRTFIALFGRSARRALTYLWKLFTSEIDLCSRIPEYVLSKWEPEKSHWLSAIRHLQTSAPRREITWGRWSMPQIFSWNNQLLKVRYSVDYSNKALSGALVWLIAFLFLNHCPLLSISSLNTCSIYLHGIRSQWWMRPLKNDCWYSNFSAPQLWRVFF